MKGTFDFKLPEEQDTLALVTAALTHDPQDFNIVKNAVKYHLAINDMFEYLRQIWKYGDDKYSQEEIEMAEKIRDEFIRLTYFIEE